MATNRLLSPVLKYFATGEDKPTAHEDPGVIKRMFEWRRLSVFISITLGYGIYYVGRLNFAVAKPSMLDEKILTATQMGIVDSALLFAYAAGKFSNGFIADRANIQKFMSWGLLIVGIINLILGSTTMFAAFVVLWGLNGWFQSIGAPASIVSMANWFSPRERGTWYGVWCTSHDIGGALNVVITTVIVGALGWRWGFWAPGVLCAVSSVVLFFTLKDRPKTYGLPSVSEFKNDPSPIALKSDSVSHLQREVLRNPAVWTLGLSSALMYITRYGMYGWAILFLSRGRGYSLTETGLMMAIMFTCSMVGEAASGLISDVFFKANRNIPCLIFGVLETVCLAAFLLVPEGNRMLDYTLMGTIGVALGVLVSFLGGLMAVDIVPPRTAGAAAGVVGMFSYIGAGIQGWVSGWLIDLGKTVTERKVTVCPSSVSEMCSSVGVDISSAFNTGTFDKFYDVTVTETHYNFDGVLLFWTIAGGLSVIAALFVWNAEKRARGVA
jgi:OPA family sugar phosphate sensor protein UhpC-like MFS transporter